MKKILFALLLIPFFAFSQGAQQPFKGANTIIVQTHETPEAAFKKVAQLLVANTFGIANSDKDLRVITTTKKETAGNSMSLNIAVSGDSVATIVINGVANFVAIQAYVGKTNDYPIEYKNKGSMHPRDVWGVMQKVASSYPNATLTYEKR